MGAAAKNALFLWATSPAASHAAVTELHSLCPSHQLQRAASRTCLLSRLEDLLAVSSRAQFPESYFDVVLFPLRELRHLSLCLKNVLNAEQHPKGF